MRFQRLILPALLPLFLAAVCDRFPEGDKDGQRGRCQAFLSPDEETAAG